LEDSKIIVALDALDRTQAIKLAQSLSGHVWGFKVNDMLVEFGVSIIEELKPYGSVFADPKLHDIPNTVANSVKRFVNVGADLITIHASSGSEAIKAAVKNRGDAKILCITALTSLDIADIESIFGADTSMREIVSRLAKLANDNGAQGVVCSAHELEHVRSIPFLKVTPGIRLGKADDDQKRVANPSTAIVNGSSYLVVGRPITQADDPLRVVKEINSRVNEAFKIVMGAI